MIYTNQILSIYRLDSVQHRVKLFSPTGIETCVICVENITEAGWYQLPGLWALAPTFDFVKLLLLTHDDIYQPMLVRNTDTIVKKWRPKRVKIGQARTLGLFTVRLFDMYERPSILQLCD